MTWRTGCTVPFGALLAHGHPCTIEMAIDVTLLGRYYKRVADHAVSVAGRLGFLVTGEEMWTG